MSILLIGGLQQPGVPLPESTSKTVSSLTVRSFSHSLDICFLLGLQTKQAFDQLPNQWRTVRYV